MRPRSTTVVAVRRGGEIAIASDGQTTWGNTPVITGRAKLRQIADAWLGMAGSVGDNDALWRAIEKHAPDWLQVARKARGFGKAVALIVPADGQILVVSAEDGSVINTTTLGVMAIGSGDDFAMGAAEAMLETTNRSAAEIARRAIEIAARFCIWTSSSDISVQTVAIRGE